MKNSTTIIIGLQRSGKTTKANEMSKGKNPIFFDSIIDFNENAHHLAKDTGCVIIEGIKPTDYDRVMELMNYEFLNIERRGQKKTQIKMPELIFTTTFLEFKNISDRPHLKIIEL